MKNIFLVIVSLFATVALRAQIIDSKMVENGGSGPKDIAYKNGMDDFGKICQVPAVCASMDAGHMASVARTEYPEWTIENKNFKN